MFHSNDDIDSGNQTNSDVDEQSNANDQSKISNYIDPDWIIQREADNRAEKGLETLSHNHPDFMEPFLNTFQKQQLNSYRYTYGVEAINAKSFDEMVYLIQNKNNNQRSSRQLQQLKLFNIFSEHNISRKASNQILSFLNEYNPDNKFNVDIRSLERDACKGLNSYEYGELTLPWPDYWNMEPIIDTFPEVKLYIMNAIEAISYLFIDPEIMFFYNDQIHFDHYFLSQQDSQGRATVATGDLMTSKWCYETQQMIRAKNPNGHILPLIFYADGVQVSDNVNNKVTTVICTTGNFSDSLLNKSISKRVISYIPNFNIYSKNVLVRHLTRTLNISEEKVSYR